MDLIRRLANKTFGHVTSKILMNRFWNIMHSEQRRKRHDVVPFFGHSGHFIARLLGFTNFSWLAGCTRASPDDGAVVRL